MEPMHEHLWLAEQFEANRTHLQAVVYRMLGNLSEADDAVQEAWLHLSRADTSAVKNLGGYLTTIVARICLDMLRANRGAKSPWKPPGPSLSCALRARATLSTKRCCPTRLVWRC